MNIDNFKTLISNLPVRRQSFTTERGTWKREEQIGWLANLNGKLFQNSDSLQISRQDVFDSKDSIRESILKTIYWGYPRGMRGNNSIKILQSIPKIETQFDKLKSNGNRTGSDFDELTKALKPIAGLGLSTYSKLLYFFEIKFNGYPCLILDQRLIDVFRSGLYDDYAQLKRINYAKAPSNYLKYLEITNKIASDLQTEGENIEQFLFLFGKNLKFEK